jgi:hypothetical protein
MPDTVRRAYNGGKEPEKSPLEAALDAFFKLVDERRHQFEQEKEQELKTLKQKHGWGKPDDTAYLLRDDSYKMSLQALEDKYAKHFAQLELMREVIPETIHSLASTLGTEKARQERLRKAEERIRDATRRASDYALQVKKYLADGQQRLDGESKKVIEQRKQLEESVKGMMRQGKEILQGYVNSLIDFALQRAKNLSPESVSEVEDARKTAQDRAAEVYETQIIQLSQVTADFTPPEDPKRYREIDEGLDDIINILQRIEPSDLLGLDDLPPKKA